MDKVIILSHPGKFIRRIIKIISLLVAFVEQAVVES